jgi:hypothetical protein
MVSTEDWVAEAVRLRREENMGTQEIAERVDRSPSRVRRVLAEANAARFTAEATSNGNGNGHAAIPGQTTVDDHLERPEDDPDHPGWANRGEFVPDAGEPLDAADVTWSTVTASITTTPVSDDESALRGTRQLALDFGPNADLPFGGTLVIKSDKLPSGFFGLGDVIHGSFTARVVDVAGKERLQRASEEFRAQPQSHVALITEISLD